MKRNLDLIRDILFRVESSNQQTFDESDFSDLSSDPLELRYNIYLAVNAKFLKAIDVTTLGSGCSVPEYTILHMTNLGCDYLDSVRDRTVWQKTKETLKTVSGSVTLEIVKTVASKIAISLLENQLRG